MAKRCGVEDQVVFVGRKNLDEVFTMLDEPTNGRYYGSLISAPVSSRVMADIMPYLGYEPQYSEEELNKLSIYVPDVVGQPLADAKGKITTSKLIYKIIGSGETVVRQLPEAGAEIYSGGTVILYTEQTGDEMTTVPNLIGLTVSEVNTIAAEAGINVEFSGNTTLAGVKSYSQSISEGESVPVGQIITVYFRDEGNADMAEHE